MRIRIFLGVGLCTVLAGAVLWGCSEASLAFFDASTSNKLQPGEKLKVAEDGLKLRPARTRITSRPANVRGKVLILEYHHVLPKEDRWARSIKNFRKDLERLYKLGYRPITLAEYVQNKFDIPPGASPVVMTFDDAHPNQFRLLPDGSIDPDSAVGIWHDFAKEHPDFPIKATWFVVPAMGFGQPKSLRKKFEMLEGWGSEIAVHTMTHSSLGKLTDAQVQYELGATVQFLESYGIKPTTVAYPYGVPPKNRSLVKNGVYKGKPYSLKAGVLAGAGPARAVRDPRVKLTALPRIQAIEGDYGITFWLNKAKRGDYELYVAP